MNRRDTIYSHFPPTPAYNYELDPERGYLSVIMPEATTNLVTNPSVELDLAGYTQHGGATLAQVFTWQAYGAAGISVTPAVSAESGLYFGTVALVAGNVYTASITIEGEKDRTYYIWFATTAGALIGSKRRWVGSGKKQRLHVTFTETSSTTRRVYVTRDAYVDQHVWYADGLQVEAKAYPTTYCDGDQKGFVINQAAYLWTGTPHVSTSTRSAQTRAGGREVSLLSLGFRILSIIGLGMAPLVDQSLAIPGVGELYQGTGTTAREFQLVGSIFADGPGPRHLQDIRDGLIDAFKPDLVTPQQPLLLRYQALDENGDPCSDTLDLVCTYQGALEGNWTNHQREDIALQFKMHLPLIRNQYTSGASVGFQTTVANANYILERDTTGLWQALSTGANAEVRVIAGAPDGTIYVGGSFTNLGGANGDYIVQWNGVAFVALGTGMNGDVNSIVFGPDGSLYASGAFTLAGGVANTAYVAKWDGANWTALSTGLNAACNALAFGPDGSLYLGGDFTNIGDANGDHIVKWTGAAWVSLGTGANNSVYTIKVDKAGNVYIGGIFPLAGGVTGTAYIAKWNGTVWSALNSGMNNTVYALAFGLDGTLYAGGVFTTVNGAATPAANIAQWNGTAWSPLGSGTGGAAPNVFVLLVDKAGLLHVGGSFTTAGGTTLPDSLAIWTGSVWILEDVDLPGTPNVRGLFLDGAGNLYVGFSTNGSAITATVTVTTSGGARAYPIINFTGPGTVWQVKNYTTGKTIYFSGLTLLAGEKATLSLKPDGISFVSTFRGNLMGYILAGSNLDWFLLSGANNVSVYLTGTTAATKAIVSWIDLYWSLDGAVVK